MTGPSEPDLPELVAQLDRRLAQRLTRCLAAADTSLREWRVLSYLANRPGLMMTEIAESLGSPAPTTTKLIDSMAARNLVYRRSDERDRRKVLILLAPRGRARYEELSTLVAHEQTQLTSLIDEPDSGELMRLLTQLLGRLDSLVDGADTTRGRGSATAQ